MTFFLDENFPKTAEGFLSLRGHAVIDIRGTPNEGIDDRCIFEMAQERKAVFLTTDRDFFHSIPHLYSSHYGIVVIALRQPNRMAILSRLSWFIDQFGDIDISGKAFLLRDRTYSIYPAD